MLSLTDRAVDAVRRALMDAEEPAGGVRITAEAGGCHGPTYNLELEDAASEADQVLDFDGVTVFVAAAVLETLENTSLDFVEDRDGAGFVFKAPPKGKGGCGCGGHGHG